MLKILHSLLRLAKTGVDGISMGFGRTTSYSVKNSGGGTE
jgi:hypothetical protein